MSNMPLKCFFPFQKENTLQKFENFVSKDFTQVYMEWIKCFFWIFQECEKFYKMILLSINLLFFKIHQPCICLLFSFMTRQKGLFSNKYVFYNSFHCFSMVLLGNFHWLLCYLFPNNLSLSFTFAKFIVIGN